MPLMMLDTRALRDAPNGAKGNGIVIAGQQIDLLQESQGWSQITRKALTGWVLSSTVGQGDFPLGSTEIDKQEFFRQCWLQGLASEVSPHYLAAVAMLRSQIQGGNKDNQVGPYLFMSPEWDAVRNVAAFDLTDLRADDINEWEYQCAAFAAVTATAIDALTTGLGRPPSAHELYLANLIGVPAAIASIQPPDELIDQNLTAEKDADLPLGGLTRPQIMSRYSTYLQDQGPPLVAVKSSVALQRIGKDLQTALDAVRADMITAGTDVLGSTPGLGDMIDKADDPPTAPSPGGPVGPIPGGNPGAPASGVGGPLGELIASKESGKAGYGAFNRGGAGDSAGKTMNFPQMQISQVMALQALSKSNPNRLFAVGRYQMIPGTMKDGVAKLSINTSLNLDAKMQEFLFRNYLLSRKRPLIKAFVTASNPTTTDLSKAQMALAFEFASVGEPGTGLSHYGGTGHNRALISPAQTAAALNAEHQAYKANLAAGMGPDQAWTALSPGAV